MILGDKLFEYESTCKKCTLNRNCHLLIDKKKMVNENKKCSFFTENTDIFGVF